MKRGILILPLITILFSSMLYFLPVQTTGVTGANLIEEPNENQPTIATGSNLVELTSGYNVTESDVYSYICTDSFVPFLVNVSDIIRYTITKTNNSDTGWGWTADCIWST
ncbi:MAG: hypothetical protein HWN67_11815, partial [Candidatus Helarchaeota archaeon]|nr:hypothetical protein [Candidatus Helarchaeota archaeon]